jgi:tRNA-specific 2-thiouridylase
MKNARFPNPVETTVVVAMSGGVDSSVAAALLVEQGYHVVGMMLRLWSESGKEAFNRCCTPEAMGLARRVAANLDIPFYAVDVRQAFRDTVVQYFLDEYVRGVTPNPCLVCNRQIRWGKLLDHAQALGAQYMATGHYARVRHVENGLAQLLRGVDLQKDQSYVLSVLSQKQLQRALFPIGGYTKSEIRALARKFALPVADRADSQDLCFLSGEDYRLFLERHAPQVKNPGPIYNQQGVLMGEHRGLAFYTIGQRKGLGISAPTPVYVAEKDQKRNALVVGQRQDLERRTLIAGEVNWIAQSPPTSPFRANVKIRYRAREAPAVVRTAGGGSVQVVFDDPLPGITPGQAVVFYQDERCLGGGIISDRQM